jgi:hypothetical protein
MTSSMRTPRSNVLCSQNSAALEAFAILPFRSRAEVSTDEPHFQMVPEANLKAIAANFEQGIASV